VFVKFLCERHGLAAGSQLHGRRALREKIELLQGFELPAGAWEDEVLPARLRQYDPDWLDELSLFGEVGWARLQPPRKADGAPWRGGGMARNVAISLFLRSDMAWLLPPDRESQVAQASSNARLVLETLEKHGASFFYDLGAATGLLPAQVEDALAELAALGLGTADGFASIRPLVSPDRKRRGDARRRRARRRRGVDPSAWRTGRWSRFPGPLPEIKPETRVDRWARLLVRRWGVVFRDLLVREPLAPPWRELVRLYRRMEARGELLGGRFVEGVSGEQYAEAPAVTRLRELRDRGPDAATVIVSTADPLNLTGVLASPVRLAATQRGSLAYRDGKLIATRTADGLALHEEVDPHLADRLERATRVTALVRAQREEESGARMSLHTSPKRSR
jgi:ATP-dependent Lhr-like helicase